MALSPEPKMTEKSLAAQASKERSIAVRQNMDNSRGAGDGRVGIEP